MIAHTAGESALLEHAGPALPYWLDELMGSAPALPLPVKNSYLTGSYRYHSGFSCTQMLLSGIEDMNILTFQQCVAQSYDSIFADLRKRAFHPVRFWAFIPRLHADYGAGLDRYMAFNAGRFAAYSNQLGGSDGFKRSVPTGSAVGSESTVMRLACLASEHPGVPVENPRQVPAYRYSRRFGPVPPCFARATRVRWLDGTARMLVGGTASIRGEESVYVGSLELQTLETFRNLASVACVGWNRGSPPMESEELDPNGALELFTALRVYHPIPGHRDTIAAMVSERFPNIRRLEVVPAELCRTELLVEIEGVTKPPAEAC